MATYQYDDILALHFGKLAFLNAAWTGAKAVGRGVFNMGAREGAKGVEKALTTGGSVLGATAPVLGSMSPTKPARPGISVGPFTIGGGNAQGNSAPGGERPPTTASLREKGGSYRFKSAFDIDTAKNIAMPASYALMLGGSMAHHVVDPHKHPHLYNALHYGGEGLGLALNAAATGHDYFGAPKDKRDWRNLADLGALAAFSAINAHRGFNPPEHH
jgi:hypothetical protein